jgi:hypothetical protein
MEHYKCSEVIGITTMVGIEIILTCAVPAKTVKRDKVKTINNFLFISVVL